MTNCYVVYSEEANQDCCIVDVGFEPKPMLDFINGQALRPNKVVLTHAHVDHIGGLTTVRESYPNIPILIHEAERDFLGDPGLNLSSLLADPVMAPEPTETIQHGQHLDLANNVFEVRHTPGHSPGGISLIQEQNQIALVGDTLFNGSIGRTDFPTSNSDQLLRSIRDQLFTLSDQTRVLPGHMDQTTIGRERATNPFVR